MLDWLQNVFLNGERYRTNSEAVVITCFYNPQISPYRLLAFQKWYQSIEHLHHRIIECLIGEDAKSQLPESPYITQVHADTLLWHKETLLNMIIKDLPEEFRYVFWVDADVLFSNQDWLVEGVEALQKASIIQPFEYCVHLNKNELKPSFDVGRYRASAADPKLRHPQMWRSFASNHDRKLIHDTDYDRHGHVGFAWGARRELLDACPLYDRALIGGADHIIAHAAAGDIDHECITKSFTDNIDDVLQWSSRFSSLVKGGLGYVKGDLYHIWHGDMAKRQYLKRIKDFTPGTKNLQKDRHGFYTMPKQNQDYMRKYYRNREVVEIEEYGFYGLDEDFVEVMGYSLRDIVRLFGEPRYANEPYEAPPVQGQPPVYEGRGDAPEISPGYVPDQNNYEQRGPASVPEIAPGYEPNPGAFERGGLAPEIAPSYVPDSGNYERQDGPVPELVPEEIGAKAEMGVDTIPFDPSPATAHTENFS